MPNNKPRKIIAIDAHGVADFRRQLDAAVVEAQRLGGVPMLPCDDDSSETDDSALVAALATAVEQVCMVQSPAEQVKAA